MSNRLIVLLQYPFICDNDEGATFQIEELIESTYEKHGVEMEIDVYYSGEKLAEAISQGKMYDKFTKYDLCILKNKEGLLLSLISTLSNFPLNISILLSFKCILNLFLKLRHLNLLESQLVMRNLC